MGKERLQSQIENKLLIQPQKNKGKKNYFCALSSIWSFHWLLIFGKLEGGLLDESVSHGT